MATKNKQIAVYLPEELESRVKDYCLTRDITRKNKEGETTPALGTAIVEILSLFFNLESKIPDNVPSTLPSQSFDTTEVERLIKDILPSMLPSNIPTLTDIETLIDSKIESKLLDIVPSNLPTETHTDTDLEWDNSDLNSPETNTDTSLETGNLPSNSEGTIPDTEKSYQAAIAITKKMILEGKKIKEIENYLTENKYLSKDGTPIKWTTRVSKIPEIKAFRANLTDTKEKENG